MRVVLITEPKQIELVEWEMPQLREHEVLVRSRVVSLGTGDADMYRGNTSLAQRDIYPLVPGRTWAGEVVQVGLGTPAHLPGKRVSIAYDNDSNDVMGGLAEYVVVPVRNLHMVEDTMLFEDAAMLGLVAEVTHAMLRGLDGSQFMALPGKGADGIPAKGRTPVVAIVGDDVTGLCAVQVAHALYPTAFLVVIGFHEARLQLARNMGATHTINIGREDAQTLVRALSHGEGADISFEGTGDTQAAVEAMLLTRKGGTVRLMGNAGANTLLSVEGNLLVRNNLSIYGTSDASDASWTLAERLHTSRLLDLAALVSHRFALEDVQEAFDELTGQTGKTMRVLVTV